MDEFNNKIHEKLEFDIYPVIMKPWYMENRCNLFSYLGSTAWLWMLPYRAVPACLALSCLELLTSLMSLVLCVLMSESKIHVHVYILAINIIKNFRIHDRFFRGMEDRHGKHNTIRFKPIYVLAGWQCTWYIEGNRIPTRSQPFIIIQI